MTWVPRPAVRSVGLVVLAVGVGAALGYLSVGPLLRLLIALALASAAILGLFVWPDLTILAILLWLPVQALARRLLIPLNGWSSYDPILMVAPAVCLIYCLLYPVFRRPWNRLTTVLLVVLAVGTVECFSPLGAGLRANIEGALFAVVPLLWYFIGRVIDPKVIDVALRALPFASLPLAAYGTAQIGGLLPWDLAWVHLSGYAALSVDGHVRPFGTFASSAEYETFLCLAVLVSAGLAMRSKALPCLVYLAIAAADAVAAFLVGSRGPVVLSIGGLGLLWAYHLPSGRGLRLVFTAAAITGAYLLLLHGRNFTPAPAATAAGSTAGGSATQSAAQQLILRQESGLAQPFNSHSSSSLPLHLELLGLGFVDGLRHPLGEGPGVVTLADERAGSGVAAPASSEVDWTDMLVADGVLGGGAYLFATVLLVAGAMDPGRRPSLAEFVLPACLLVTAAQWMNGGFYFLSPFIWLLIGGCMGNRGAARAPARAPAGWLPDPALGMGGLPPWALGGETTDAD